MIETENIKTKHNYKQTQLGLIPVEWEVVKLGNVGEFKNGINKGKDDFGFGVPFINLMDVFGKPVLIPDDWGLVNATKLELENYNLNKGDVLFIRSSVKPTGVGLTSVVKEDMSNTVYSGFLIRYRPHNKNIFNTDFLQYCFHETGFRQRLIVRSSSSANTNINQENLKQLSIKLPPLPEQQKIAAILSTWDRAIAKQQQLIAAKQQFKKGLMQRLLTGKQRFAGFEGEWIKSKLGKHCNILMCKRIFNNETNENDEIPFYKIGTVGKKADAFISRKLFEEYKEKYNYPRLNEVLVTCSGTVGKCFQFNGEEAYFQDSNIVWLDNPKNEIDNKFLYYLISTFDWGKLNSTTITRIYTSDLRSMKVSFPSLKEQQKIASVLRAADKEIALLQKQLTQLQTQKRGLMQWLLTGAVRVEI